MLGKEDLTVPKAYQSDQGETEDEEVKRNCIMGESGMRDSDFSDDSDFESEDEENEGIIVEETKQDSDSELKGDRMKDLVKFVSVGSQILKPKGVVLYRPTPIMPSLVTSIDTSDDNDKTTNDLSSKSFSPAHIKAKSEFSPRSNVNEVEISVGGSGSNCDSDSDSNNDDVESVESDADTKSTSLNFPFDRGAELSMDVGEGLVDIAPETEEGCCRLSIDDHKEAQETMTMGYALVGASGASVDDKWLTAKQKRVLSSSALSALNEERGHSTDVPKKMRISQQSSGDVCAIPEITLDIKALDQILQPLPRQYLVRDESQLIPSSSDDEEDKMLSEELEDKFQNYSMGSGGATLPIPLLTPPQSPRTIDEAQTITSIEWPSNLVMDNTVIKAFANISPVSTDSTKGEQLKNDSSSLPPVVESSQRNMAPRLRTISVGIP